MNDELVNHPQHYGGDSVYEVIKVLEAWGLDGNARLFNAVKYIARAGKKNGASYSDDLKKAQFYLNREITRLDLEAVERRHHELAEAQQSNDEDVKAPLRASASSRRKRTTPK